MFDMQWVRSQTGNYAKSLPSLWRQWTGSKSITILFGQSVVISDCPVCHGSGEMNESPCSACNGQGVEKKKSTLKIKIPKGVEAGNYMTLEGQGNQGGKGIHPGDLIVFFDEKEHPYFTRRGQDIFLEAKISFSQAVLGDTIKVPTIDGHASLKIPPGIQSGQILRMRNKGLPRVRGNQLGDQLVRIQVVTPKSVSKKESRLIEELAELNGHKEPEFSKIDI